MMHGTLGFRFLHFISSLDWALFGCGPSPSYLAHVPLSRVHGLASAFAMPLHCSCYDITYHFILLLPLGLQAEALASLFLTLFLLWGFTGQHSC